jgi:glutamyl-tRNA reductase
MPTGVIFVLGLTHRTAPLGVRERLALSAESEAEFSRELTELSGLAEFAIVNTCNRLEIYGVGRDAAIIDRVARAFCARQKLALADFDALRLERVDEAALRHLFAVAAGLDSQMLGETEIFGQVKKAYANAQARGTAGAVLNRVFQKTFQAVKQARSQTGISAGLVSVANVAVDLALTIFGPGANGRVLLLGAGEIGRKCGRAFLSRGTPALTIASRRQEHAAEVAAEIGGQVMPLEDCTARLAEFDIVVGATASPHTVIGRDAVAAAMRARQGRPMFFIDTAMPRDIDTAVAQIENVFLYDLDDLARIAAENRTAREAEISKCQTLLNDRAGVLWTQCRGQLAGRVESEPAHSPAVFAAVSTV